MSCLLPTGTVLSDPCFFCSSPTHGRVKKCARKRYVEVYGGSIQIQTTGLYVETSGQLQVLVSLPSLFDGDPCQWKGCMTSIRGVATEPPKMSCHRPFV